MMHLPEGAMKRFARTAVGVLLMFMLLLPLQNCEKQEISFRESSAEENAAYKTSYSDIIMDIYERTMKNAEAG